jgi:RNA polymerase sigma-70 factor (ECF subfamily)
VSPKAALKAVDPDIRMRTVVDQNTDFVARTLRRAGVPSADLDDEIQRTFIVVAERLERVEPGAERAYLYQVANNVAWHARRGLARRREILAEDPPETIEAFQTPEYLAHRKGMRQIVDGILETMPAALRQVFLLYEVEGMSLVEIAEQLRVARGTIASRLRRARALFRKDVAAIQLAWDLDAVGANDIDERPLLQGRRRTPLERALISAGASRRGSSATRAKTLAVLGLS